MHERCETVNQPRASPPLTNQQTAWRSIMHMKSCPQLVRSEVRLEPGTRNVNCGNPGVVGVAGVRGRSPLTVISANTLHRGNNHNTNGSSCHGDAWRRKAKGSQGGEGLYRKGGGGGGGGGATGVEGEGPVDIWAVIKPGNVRQKIAIFTSVSPPIGGSDGWAEDALKHEVTPVSTPAKAVSLKVKGGVRDRESCSSAKRRRRSGSNRHHLHHQQRDLTTNTSSPAEEPLSQAARGSGEEAGGDEEEEEEDGGGGVCVVDMVALLEQKANVNTQSCTTKAPPSAPPTAPATAPPTTTAPPSALPTTAPPSTPPTVPPSAPNEGSEVEEGSEVIRVSDMVARLESECLKRSNSTSGGGLSRSNSTSGGGLSRSNSLRRCQPSSPPQTSSSSSSSSSPPSLLPEGEVVSSALPVVPSEAERGLDREDPERLRVCLEEVRGPGPTAGDGGGVPREPEPEPPTSSQAQPQAEDHSDSQCNVRSLKAEPVTAPRPEEPPPGMLFFSSGLLRTHSAHAPTHSALAPTDSALAPTHTTNASTHATQASTRATHAPTDPCSASPLPPADCHLSSSPREFESGREEERRSSEDDDGEEQGGVVACFPLHRSVSQEFLAVRQTIQRLLDPQPFLTLLPHHLLVHVFSLLPTCSLAALQCTCHYFRLVIRSYGVRPADSRWVSDPRYRDDPCKQCKRRYGRGDVSLCRWHHKPYFQAHPYGPGFWMCCHGARRDAPGCNVGLHDNRWVPAFHSINAPVYRRGGGGGLGQRSEDSVED